MTVTARTTSVPARATSVPTRLAHLLAARDPGRARLLSAGAVSAGVLCSALLARGVVDRLHADAALLAVGVFLSVQAGNVVKDRTPRARAVTALLLIPTVVTAIAVAALLSSSRPALLAVFVAVTGVATWVRRFGPRATAIGMLAFLGYFFTVFVRPTGADLPAYCLVAVAAVTTQAAARALLRLEHPRRRLAVLLAQLRVASAAALRAATRPARSRTLRARLARVDAVGSAITSWQEDYPTAASVTCDEQTLARLVLDARVSTEVTCDELARVVAAGPGTEEGAAATSLAHLSAVLDPHASQARIDEAATWAVDMLASRARPAAGAVADRLVARTTLAHVRVREIEPTRGARVAPRGGSTRAAPTPPTTAQGGGRPRWTPWRQWAPTSRLAVQAMIAASAAAVVGEAVSATRWYWAVTSAFLIFAGTTTRGGVLTRAYRRVAGTAAGIVVGIGAVLLADQHTSILVAISVVAVFGMLYLGPVNYVYSSFFMTIVVVAIYAMLGVLHHRVLELRLEETVAGAVIGVVCAYLILSANSHPALMAKVDTYFRALDRLLEAAERPFRGRGGTDEILAAVHGLEAARDDVDQTVSAMSAALVGRRAPDVSAVHLMYVATRSGALFAESAITRGTHEPGRPRDGDLDVQDAVAVVREAADAARSELVHGREPTDPVEPDDASRLQRLPSYPGSPATPALLALARIDWALRRLARIRDRSVPGHASSRTPARSGARPGRRETRRAPTTARRCPTAGSAGGRRRRRR